MARPIKGKSDFALVKQGNYITTAKYDYTPTEKRILYRIVEKASDFREENRAWFDKYGNTYVAKDHVKFRMPITMFMTKDQMENGGGIYYDEIVEAFNSLTKKRIEFKTKDSFSFGALLNSADREAGAGEISFVVHKFVWQSAVDYSKGFAKIDLVIAMQLKSAYSMRFYEMARAWKDKMNRRLSVEHFREEFGCVDKYPRVESLKRCVIDAAKKELDKYSPISFTYEQEKSGRTIKNFYFHFYENKKCIHLETEKKNLLSLYPTAAIPSEIRQWFSNKLGMTSAQINSNIILFDKLYQLFRDSMVNELEETFQYIYSQGFRPQENIGWFIQNLKKKVENATK